jgi:hypothetical protein
MGDAWDVVAQGFNEHWVRALKDRSYLSDVASPDAGGVGVDCGIASLTCFTP